ncbi:MAG: thiamine diphosphokinase [Oscillospiraceae bacterium]|jgi:thiamine pyrophosphokinase|nr:thiamine diphosphokinase [Oscillospiraceae bacterium]
MKRCVIAGASPEVFWDSRWVPDMVICADGGYSHAVRLGLKPDLIIGDNDSSGEKPPLSIVHRSLPVEKDITDMEACIDYALQAGAGEIALLGASGGRLDHFLGNIGLLERADGKAFMLDSSHEIHLLPSPVTVEPPHKHRYFSVVPLDETASGVTITGAKYPLDNATLRRAATVGISNEPLDGVSFTVSVKNGKALLVLSEKLI